MQLSYVGHSMGSLLAFACFSRNAELAARVHTLVALAPATRVSHVQGIFGLLADYMPLVEARFWLIRVGLLMITYVFLNYDRVLPRHLHDSACTACWTHTSSCRREACTAG